MRLKGLFQALQATPRITEALRAVGVDDYLRQQTRVTARLPTQTEADLLRMARNRPVLVTENINVDRAERSSNSRQGVTRRRACKSFSNPKGLDICKLLAERCCWAPTGCNRRIWR